MPTDPRVVTRADHDAIQKRISLQGNEDYAVTVQKAKGFWLKTVHVFNRRPMLKEINDYEQTASRVKFKGQNAQLEGSQINAASTLYNTLINRAYDVLVGPVRVAEQLDTADARAKVDPLIKREAIRELVGEVYSSTRMEEAVGSDIQTKDSDDDDPEAHTSAEPQASEP